MFSSLQQGKVEKEQIIDIGYYVHIVKVKWLSIALFSILCTAISILFALSLKPTYKATATLLIESSQKKAISIEEVVGIDTSAKEYYLTQFEILKSNQVALRVIDKLDLENNIEFNPSLIQSEPSLIDNLKAEIKSLPVIASYLSKDETDSNSIVVDDSGINQTVLKIFKSKLSIEPIRKTQLVNISFESLDPNLAATIANEVAHAYIENSLESKLVATEQATGWINQRLASLKKQLEDSEQALLLFLKQQKLIDNSGIEALTSSELTNLTDRISSATNQRIEAQSLYNALKSKPNGDISSISSVSLISNHPQIRDIRLAESNAEKQVSELSKRYGPKHDKMIQAQAQLQSIQLRANKLTKKLIDGVEKELISAREQEQMLKSELLSKKAEFQSLSVVKREYDALKREVDTNAKLYDLFLTRQKETTATRDFSASNARFSDYALVPLKPSKPNRKLIVLLALCGSIGFAVLTIIFLDAFNSRIESSRDFENKLGLLPTGAIPMISDKKYKNSPIDASVFASERYSVFQESVDSIRTSLYLSLRNSQRKLLAISSAVPAEGKTTTAVNLAMSFAKLERVLLIDCDLRKPSVAERFSLPSSQAGLVNVLLTNASVEECITSVNENLDVMTGGMLAPNPQEILSSAAFEELIEELATKYDRIILDTPPILPVKDAYIIGRLAQGLVLVMKANSTSKSVYNHTMTLLNRHGVSVDGVVLNQVPIRKEGKHAYTEYSLYAYGKNS